MHVCCLYCGVYFGELSDDSDFCSDDCEKKFMERLKIEE